MLDVNEYFEGRVKSIAFNTATLPATVGVMEPGEYHFSTAKPETMHVVSGCMTVRLPGSDDWQVFDEGDRFDLPADAEFEVRIEQQTAYLCLYH